MSKICTENWGNFHIYDIFDIDSGTKLDKVKMKELKPEINFVGRASTNNGVTTVVDRIDGLEPYREGSLTLALGGSYLGSCFIQDKPFYTSQNVVVLIPKDEMSDYAKRFIAVAIRKESSLHYKAFVDELNPHIKTDFVFKLPIDKSGNPDFLYMDKYMHDIEAKANNLLTKVQSARISTKDKINTTQWGEFKVGDLLPNIIKPSVYHTREVTEDDTGIPYIVRTKFNNGLKYRVQKKNDMNPSPANTISFGAENATFFFQPEEWVSGRDMYYIDTTSIEPYACLFLVACLGAITHKYSYNYGMFPNLVKEEYILLPVDDKRKPDWGYMETYMRKLEKYLSVALTTLQNSAK